MKCNLMIRGMLMIALCFAFCGTGKAQDWKSIISGVAKAWRRGRFEKSRGEDD